MEDARFTRFVDDDGASSTAPPTPPTTVTGSRRDCSSAPTCGPSRPTGSPDRPRATRAWRCSRGWSAGAISRCAARTARAPAWPPRPTASCGPTRRRATNRTASWEMLQVGNCGPPIETDAGLAGAHPWRRPDASLLRSARSCSTSMTRRRSSADSNEPLLEPQPRREATATSPTSCIPAGRRARRHCCGCPTAIDDARIGVASVPLDELLAALTGV